MINRRDFIQLGASSILALSASRFAFAKSDTQVDLRIVAKRLALNAKMLLAPSWMKSLLLIICAPVV